jgi:hypothetical protein
MYWKKFNSVSLSKHRILVSTICLSLSVSFLASQSVTCQASHLEKSEDEQNGNRQSSLARWQPIVVDPAQLQPVDFTPGLNAYKETAKFLKTYTDQKFADGIAEREAKLRSTEEKQVDEKQALVAYQTEKVAEAWRMWLSLRDLLNITNTRYPYLLGVLSQLMLQNGEMHAHFVATEKSAAESKHTPAIPGEEVDIPALRSQLATKDEELARLRTQSGQASETAEAQVSRIKSLEAEIAAQKAADKKKLEEEEWAAKAATQVAEAHQKELQDKDAEIARLQEQLSAVPAPKPIPAPKPVDQDRLLQLRAEVEFYKACRPWYSRFWGWMWNLKPDVATLRLRQDEEV